MCRHCRAILAGGCDVGESWQLTGGAASAAAAAAVEETKPDTKQMLPLLQLQPLPWFSVADRTATSRTSLRSTQPLISWCEPGERRRLGSGSRRRVHLNANRHSIKVNFNYPQQTLDFHLLLRQYKESRRLNLKFSLSAGSWVGTEVSYFLAKKKTFRFKRTERNGGLITEGSEVVVELQW